MSEPKRGYPGGTPLPAGHPSPEPAPAQSREEEALVKELGSIAYNANMHTPAGYAEMLKKMDAALRSRQSPPAAVGAIRELLESIMAEEPRPEENYTADDALENVHEFAEKALECLPVDTSSVCPKVCPRIDELVSRIAAVSHPSPQGEDAENIKRLQKAIDDLATMIERHNRQDNATGVWDYDYGSVAEAQRALITLRARLASAQEAEEKRIDKLLWGWKADTERIAKEYEARLASAPSSAQGEEEREMREARIFREATNAIYFGDSSDYKPTLYTIIDVIKPGYSPDKIPFFETDAEARAALERKEEAK